MWEDEESEPINDVSDPITHKARMLAAMCASCIMRPANKGRILIDNARLHEFIADARRKDSYVICHSTIYRDDITPAICRGFADAYSTNYLRIMERLNGIVEVPVPDQT